MSYSEEEVAELEAARVSLDLVGMLLHEEPSQDFLRSIVQAGVFDEAPYGQGNPNVEAGLRLMGGWAHEAAARDETLAQGTAELRDDWLNLLVGLGQPAAPSWESFYTEADHRLFAQNSVDLKRSYERFGASLQTSTNEPVDHLGIILRFVAYLVGLEVSFDEQGDQARAQSAREEQRRVLEEHVLSWLPSWYSNMKTAAKTDYYSGLADLLFGLVQAHVGRFGIAYHRASNVFRA